MLPCMTTKSHWESVYRTKAADAVSWYAPHLNTSVHYIRRAAPALDAAIIDVGGGESTLVDDLLAAGYAKLTVLDISATAIDATRRRLGPASEGVNWLAADVLKADLPAAAFDVWHDRAVFHFLNSTEQRQRYVEQVRHALKPGGFAIFGTFGPQGPEKCSGLPVSRYSADELHHCFGDPFQLLDSRVEQHTTPWGTQQQFVYCFCRCLASRH
jgi:SAM-dependent methyltransferase